MIVADMSALLAILFQENEAESCTRAIGRANRLLMSAGTLAEAQIVAAGRGIADQMSGFILELGADIVPVTAASARRIGAVYARWGKGKWKSASSAAGER